LSRCKNPPLPCDLPKHQDIHLVLTMGKAHEWEGVYSQNGLGYCLIIGPPWGMHPHWGFTLHLQTAKTSSTHATAYVHVFCSPNPSNRLRMIVQHHCSLKQLQVYPKRILCGPTLNPVTISDFQELTLPAAVSLRCSIVEAISLGHSSIEGAHAPYSGGTTIGPPSAAKVRSAAVNLSPHMNA
jgi:hypothetical protein